MKEKTSMSDPYTDQEDDSCPCCGQLWADCCCTPAEIGNSILYPALWPYPITEPGSPADPTTEDY